MKPALEAMSIPQLIAEFVAIGIVQDDALGLREIARFNRTVDRQHAIQEELKARSPDQRRVLMDLYRHENMQVRLNAATATLAVEPHRARQALEAIVKSKHFPQAGYAGMTLLSLDRGIFKPT